MRTEEALVVENQTLTNSPPVQQNAKLGTIVSDPASAQKTTPEYKLKNTATGKPTTPYSLMMDTPFFESVPFVYDGRDRIVLPKQFTPGESRDIVDISNEMCLPTD